MLLAKSAVVTGAGKGIGRAISLACAGAGADVVLVSRTESDLASVAGEVRALGRRAVVVVADVANAADVDCIVAEALHELDRIDVWVNNAAISEPKLFLETTPEYWDRIMTVNLTSVYLCCRAVLEPMIEQGGGRIINIASGAGVRGHPGNAIYSASKAGVIAFTQALAGEVKDLGIQANVICPGPVWTQMSAAEAETEDAARLAQFMQPEDVAAAALYLASDASGKINAQTLHVRVSNRW